MRCFCFKPKDKNATEPNARPVATETGGSRISIFAAAVPSAPDIVTTVASVAASGTSGNLGTGNLGTPDTLRTVPAIENGGTEHTLTTGKQIGIPDIPGTPDNPELAESAEAPTVADSAAQTTWEKAIGRLTPEELAFIDLTPGAPQTKLDILHLFVQETTLTKEACESRQWTYTNTSGDEIFVRDRVNTLLTNLNKYTAIADFIVQPPPSVGSLAWSGCKLLLHAATTDMDNTALAMESMDTLARVLVHCGIYERLYTAQPMDAAAVLEESLVALYVLVLQYLCYLKKHLGRNTAERSFRNIAAVVKEMWAQLLAAEMAVDKEAGIAQQEATAIQLHAHTQGISEMLALLREANALREPILRIKNTVEDIFRSIQDDERLKVLNWLSDQSPKQHHEYSKSFHSAGTGGGLQDKAAFRQWRAAESSSLLWLHGIAGSGKTTLASKIIDEIEPETSTTGDCLAYFYCNYGEEQRRDPSSILRSLIKQLCLRSPDSNFPETVLAVYNQRKRVADLGNLLSIDECKFLLIKLSTGFPQITIVLDALDECEPKMRERLLDAVDAVVAEATMNPVKVFVTSRDDANLRKRFAARPAVYIQEHDNSADISLYIRTEIEACIGKRVLLDGNVSDELKERVVGVLEAGARGRFIWVKYQIQKICNEITAADVEQALTELSEDLNTMYTEILQTIRVRHKNTGRYAMAENALKWILFACRPLSLEELLEAIAVGSTAGSDRISLPILFDICENLVVLDERLGVLRFAHFSVEEFLLQQFNMADGHACVANACLGILMTPGATAPGQQPAMSAYAVDHWPEHVRLSAGAPTTAALCLEFLRPSEAYSAWLAADINLPVRPAHPEHHSPLLVASYHQLVGIFGDLLRTETDLNSTNGNGLAALHLAAANGNEEIIELLIARPEVDVNLSRFSLGRTPLSFASAKGHEKVVRMLLELKAVDADSPDMFQYTPLAWAARNGYSLVVGELLRKTGVEVNPVDIKGRTPLCWAAEMGHESVVRMLLENPAVAIDIPDRSGQSPIFKAAQAGHEAVLRILLRRNVNVDIKDQRDRTPLSRAAQNGHEKVVRILLAEAGVKADGTDEKTRRTPLAWAADFGRDRVVQVLLDTGRVNVESKDSKDQTPLSLAAFSGHERVVRLLVQNGADVNSMDGNKRTAFFWAAQAGRRGVVQILLGNKTINVNCPDAQYRQTPLFVAAGNQHEGVVEVLLADSRVDANIPDTNDSTPLIWAAKRGYGNVVRMLLGRPEIDVNTKDAVYGQSPLFWAAENGHLEVVEVLLWDSRVDINSVDNRGVTPVSMAKAVGHDQVVDLLLAKGAVKMW